MQLEYRGDPVDGPYLAMWGQSDWIPSVHPEQLPASITLGRSRIRRLFGARAFLFGVRLQPHHGHDLRAFSDEISDLFSLPESPHEPQPGDRAIFLSGGQWARDARHALARDLDHIGRRGGDLHVAAFAVRVWRPQ